MQSAGFMRRSGAGAVAAADGGDRGVCLLASISAYAALLASGNGAEPLLEAESCFFYLVFVTIYAFGCLAVCRKPGFLAALIPVLSLRASCSVRSF